MIKIAKEYRKVAGVYKITNLTSNRVYIGSTNDLYKRCQSHIKELRTNKHPNQIMQSDFNKTGLEKSFKCEVLYTTSIENKLDIEQIYVNHYYDDQQKCYNLKKNVIQEERSCYSHTPEETKRKMSDSQKAYWSNEEVKKQVLKQRKLLVNQEEFKKNVSIASKAAWEKGGQQMKDNHSKIMSKRWESEEFRNKILNDDVFNKRTNSRKNKKIIWHKEKCDNIKSIVELYSNNKPESTQHLIYYNANLLSPDGILYKNIDNLEQFCIEKNLEIIRMRALISFKEISFKGWIKYIDLKQHYDIFSHLRNNTELSGTKKQNLDSIIGYSKQIYKYEYVLKSPDGIEYKIDNVTKFVNEHSLSRNDLNKIFAGKTKQYKGWTLVSKIQNW